MRPTKGITSTAFQSIVINAMVKIQRIYILVKARGDDGAKKISKVMLKQTTTQTPIFMKGKMAT